MYDTTLIHIRGGLIQGIYKVYDAPHDRVIILNDDELGTADFADRQELALAQLEGEEQYGTVEYDCIHSELSNWISSEDVYETE